MKQKQFQMTKVVPQPPREPVRKVIQTKAERHSAMGFTRNESPPARPPEIVVEKKKVEPKRFDASEFRIKR